MKKKHFTEVGKQMMKQYSKINTLDQRSPNFFDP